MYLDPLGRILWISKGNEGLPLVTGRAGSFGLGFRVWGLGFRVQGLGLFRVEISGFKFQGLGFRVYGSGLRS